MPSDKHGNVYHRPELEEWTERLERSRQWVRWLQDMGVDLLHVAEDIVHALEGGDTPLPPPAALLTERTGERSPNADTLTMQAIHDARAGRQYERPAPEPEREGHDPSDVVHGEPERELISGFDIRLADLERRVNRLEDETLNG